jgi:hypothetical protein
MKPDLENISSTEPFPGEVHPVAGGGILVSKLDEVINWARSNSLWPLVLWNQLLRNRNDVYCRA